MKLKILVFILYGDDFTLEQIAEWYKDEEEAYFNLGAKGRENYKYGYHMLNYEHGFSFLPDNFFNNVLSVGGAYGDELQPVRNKIGNIIITESSMAFSKGIIDDKINYIKSQPTGKIPFNDNTFDYLFWDTASYSECYYINKGNVQMREEGGMCLFVNLLYLWGIGENQEKALRNEGGEYL